MSNLKEEFERYLKKNGFQISSFLLILEDTDSGSGISVFSFIKALLSQYSMGKIMELIGALVVYHFAEIRLENKDLKILLTQEGKNAVAKLKSLMGHKPVK